MSVGWTCKYVSLELGLLCPLHQGRCREQGDPRGQTRNTAKPQLTGMTKAQLKLEERQKEFKKTITALLECKPPKETKGFNKPGSLNRKKG